MGKREKFPLEILGNPLDDATANTRLFAYRFWKAFGIDQPVEIEQKVLADMFGLSLHVIREAIRHLKRYDHLTVEPCQQRLGRPIFRYHLRPRTPPPIHGGLPPDTSYHTELIEELLSPSQHTILKAPEKILLAILLRCADLVGRVDNLGFAQLRALTGCSDDRLRHYLRQLTSKEYLYPTVYGMTCRYLLGQCHSLYAVKLKNRHWLKESHAPRKTFLLHSESLPTRASPKLVIPAYFRATGQADSKAGSQLELEELAKVLWCDPVSAKQVLPFFRDRDSLWHHLKYRLEKTGVQLVKMALEEDSNPADFEVEIKSELATEMLRHTMTPLQTESTFPTEKQVERLIDILYGLVLKTAENIIKELKVATDDDEPITQYRFILHPGGSEIDTVALCLFEDVGQER